MKKIIALFLLVSVLTLSSCTSASQTGEAGKKQTLAEKTRAAVSGIFGRKEDKGWSGGASLPLRGLAAGSELGRLLDQTDMAYHQQSFDSALSSPLNAPVIWVNPENGHSGSVTSLRETRQASTGGLCRQYRQTITVDGQTETVSATACQNAGGVWQIID